MHRPVPRPGRSSPAANLLELQRSAGNQAVVQLLKKPKVPPLSSEGSLVKKWEAATREQDTAKVSATSQALHTKDADLYARTVCYKLAKHQGHKAKQDLYGFNIPAAAVPRVLDTAWQQRSSAVVTYLAYGSWSNHQAQCKQLALKDPDLFIDDFVLHGLRSLDAGKQQLIGMVQEKAFLSSLKVASPTAFARLVAAVPMLKLISTVEADVAAEQLAEGKPVPIMEVVDKLFDAFVTNRGMNVAYSGSKIDQNDVLLTGQTAADKQNREAKAKITDIPKELSTACHELLQLFTSVLGGYPGLESLTIQPGSVDNALLTKAMGAVPGGLIKSDYAGNVWDDDGPTGQIFFSGNQARPSKSHSWVIINGVAYDPVLGTRGPQVAAAMDGLFEFDGDSTVADEEGGTRKLTRDRTVTTSGRHGITGAWRLTGS